jgi:acyl-CoA thioesterase FadM
MNLWLRMLGVLIASLFRPRLGYFDESVITGRVWITDLDINVHMNNARYLAVMDLGRLDLFLRTGMMRTFIRRRWQPLMGAASVRFRRALRPFESFTLHSRFVGWDERRAYVEHWIEVDGTVSCHAVMWAAFRSAGQRVPPEAIARDLGFDGPSPALPAWVQTWRNLEATVSDFKMDESAKAAE